MKKILRLFIITLFLCIFLTSCNNKNEDKVTQTTSTIEKTGKHVYFAAPLFRRIK